MRHVWTLSAGLAGVLSSAALAATYSFTITPAASTLNTSSSLEAPIPGSLIGDYDATTNPTGTQTRPGIIGGSGNVAIPLTMTLDGAGASTTNPTGAFSLTADTNAGTLSADQFAADFLNGALPSFDVDLLLLYSTFRTFNPNSVFPGGVPIPLPLGSASISVLSAAQSGPAAGTLTPAEGSPGVYTFALVIPVDVTLVADANGQPVAPPPFPLPLTLTGSLTLAGASATLDASIDVSGGQTVPGPFPGGGFENLPLPLPTVLPPGATANVLLTGELQSITFSTAITGALHAVGARPCPGDANGDGRVDFADLNIVLGAFGSMTGQPAYNAAADFNADGRIDFSDLNVVLSAFGQNC